MKPLRTSCNPPSQRFGPQDVQLCKSVTNRECNQGAVLSGQSAWAALGVPQGGLCAWDWGQGGGGKEWQLRRD